MELLPRQPQYIATKVMHERLEEAGFTVTRRKVERDLQGLMESGFVIVVDTTQEPHLLGSGVLRTRGAVNVSFNPLDHLPTTPLGEPNGKHQQHRPTRRRQW